MLQDQYASSQLSQILSWIVAGAVIVTLLAWLIGSIAVLRDASRWMLPLGLWVVLTQSVAGPLGYVVLLLLLAAAYPCQSVWAMLSTLLLAAYVPLILGWLLMLGIVGPLFLAYRIAFDWGAGPSFSKPRIATAFVLAPLAAIVGYALLFLSLPLAAVGTHWLREVDVIGATNGPATVAYSTVLKHTATLPVPTYFTGVTRDDRDMLRNHVAGFYLGGTQRAAYVSRAYPALRDSLEQMP